MPVADYPPCAMRDRAKEKHHDPRSYLAAAEAGRVKQAAADLRAAGTTMFAS